MIAVRDLQHNALAVVLNWPTNQSLRGYVLWRWRRSLQVVPPTVFAWPEFYTSDSGSCTCTLPHMTNEVQLRPIAEEYRHTVLDAMQAANAQISRFLTQLTTGTGGAPRKALSKFRRFDLQP